MNEYNVSKRNDYISWDDYFMSIAILSSMRSKDPNTQVGAVVVDKENKILSTGYNGFPNGCSDDLLPWDRGSCEPGPNTKYFYVVHAEANAVTNANMSLRGSRMYCVLFPCNVCAGLIIQSGIKEVIYFCDKYASTESVIAAKRLFDLAGVKFTQFTPKTKKIEIDLEYIL